MIPKAKALKMKVVLQKQSGRGGRWRGDVASSWSLRVQRRYSVQVSRNVFTGGNQPAISSRIRTASSPATQSPVWVDALRDAPIATMQAHRCMSCLAVLCPRRERGSILSGLEPFGKMFGKMLGNLQRRRSYLGQKPGVRVSGTERSARPTVRGWVSVCT